MVLGQRFDIVVNSVAIMSVYVVEKLFSSFVDFWQHLEVVINTF